VSSGDFSIGSKVWPGTSKLLEEMGELQQVLGKLMGTAGDPAHWDGSDLRTRIVEEIADLQAAIAFFQEHNLSAFQRDCVAERAAEKRDLFESWHWKQAKRPTEPA